MNGGGNLGPAFLQELEDDLCHVFVGQRPEQARAWWRNAGGGLGTPRSRGMWDINK